VPHLWFHLEEEKGLPEEGIGRNALEDVPPNWVCPDCGARKEDFEQVKSDPVLLAYFAQRYNQ